MNVHNPFKSTSKALTFVDEARKYHKEAIEKFLDIFREVNYEISGRKERIDALEDELKRLTEVEVNEKVNDILEQINKEGERAMRLLAATVLKDKLNLQFWSSTYEEYRKIVDPMIISLKDKLFWAKGEYPSAK